MNKKKIIPIIIGVIVIALIAAVSVIFVMKKSNNKAENTTSELDSSEENLAKITITHYIDAYSAYEIEKILAVTDLKGTYAWEKCTGTEEEKVQQFVEKYNSVNEKEVEQYIENFKNEITYLKNLYVGVLDKYNEELSEIGKLEPVDNVEGLTKIRALINATYSYKEEKSIKSKDVTFYLYNGKIIAMIEKK